MADGMIKSWKLLVVSRKWVGAAVPRLLMAVFSSLFSVGCLLLPVSCCAEALTDPTKPPASISAPAAQSDVAAADKPASLQTIIIAKNRRAAIIDGQTVELGGKVGEAKLIEVNTANVVLRTTQGRQVLTLFPDVKITSSKTEAPPMPAHKKVTSREKK